MLATFPSSVSFLLFLSLCFLPLFSLGMISFGEILRLLCIVSGISVLALTKRKLWFSDGSAGGRTAEMVVLLTLVFSFIVAQFSQPDTVIGLLVPFVLVLGLFFSVLIPKVLQKDRLIACEDSWAKWVLSGCVGAILLLLATNTVFHGGQVFQDYGKVSNLLRIVQVPLLYFSVSDVVYTKRTVGGGGSSYPVASVLLLVAVLALGCAGVYESARAYGAYARNQRISAAYAGGDYATAVKIFKESQDANEKLGFTPLLPREYGSLASFSAGSGDIMTAIALQEKRIGLLGQAVVADEEQLYDARLTLGHWYIKQGDLSRGKGVYNSLAAPPKTLETLLKLKEFYTAEKNKGLLHSVWRDTLSITLEDFSTPGATFRSWGGSVKPTASNIGRTDRMGYGTEGAAYIEADYQDIGNSAWSYWGYWKRVPPMGRIGIRMKVRSEAGWNSRGTMVLSVNLGRTNGVLRGNTQQIGEEWVDLSIEGLGGRVRKMDAYVDSVETPAEITIIGVDTHGEPCRFYIDDIQVYYPAGVN